MSMPSLLDAAQASIEPYYHDVWGARHALSIDTKRTFLDAMGLAFLGLASLLAEKSPLTSEPCHGEIRW
ncbi:MAG: hypothetical protein ACLQJR_01915 [Stellaceae bacterium]